MAVFGVDCEDLDDCYSKKIDKSFFDEFIEKLNEEQELNQPSTTSISRFNTERQLRLGNIQDYENDDEYSKMGVFDELELVDNGLTWSYKTKFVVKKIHLVICISRNDIGDSITTKIIIPSDLDRGKPFQVSIVGERAKDNEIVEGDSFSIRYEFNKVLFDPKGYSLVTKGPSEPCGLDMSNKNNPNQRNQINLIERPDELKYTYLVALQFLNVTSECNFNYTLNLKVSNHPNFVQNEIRATNPSIGYPLKVLTYIAPYFIENNLNKTVQIYKPGDLNKTDVVITGQMITIQSDKTIELNCQANGRPKPSYSWLKDNNLVNLVEEKFKIENGSLKIFRAHSVDSGNYECQVANRYGRINRSFNVKVKSSSTGKLVIIIVSSIAVFILSVLLCIAFGYLIKQKRKHKKLIVIIIIFLFYYEIFVYVVMKLI